MLGNIIISSVYICFLGPYLNAFRENFVINTLHQLLKEKSILYSEVISMNKLVGNPLKIQDWVINGLPSDSGSIDNSVILFESQKPCLLIDPQKQALKFLCRLFKNDYVI